MDRTQDISRRAFLVAASAGAACFAHRGWGEAESIGADVSRSATARAGERGVKLDAVTQETFAACRGTHFLIGDESAAAVEVELIDVWEFRTKAAESRPLSARTPFSVLFRGPKGCVVRQGTYAVEHDGLGTLELFLVPVGPQQDALILEAAFA